MCINENALINKKQLYVVVILALNLDIIKELDNVLDYLELD